MLTVDQLEFISTRLPNVDDRTQAISIAVNNLKSKPLAYIIGAAFGCLGLHRMYCGKTKSGILQFVLVMCGGIGLIWVLMDVVLTSRMVDDFNDRVVTNAIWDVKIDRWRFEMSNTDIIWRSELSNMDIIWPRF